MRSKVMNASVGISDFVPSRGEYAPQNIFLRIDNKRDQMGTTDSKATADPSPAMVPTLEDAVKRYLDDLVSEQKYGEWNSDYEANQTSQEIMFRLMMLLHQCPDYHTPTLRCVALLICHPFILTLPHGLLPK